MPDGPPRRRTVLRSVAALAITGFVAGCAGDEESTQAPTASPPETAPAATADDTPTPTGSAAATGDGPATGGRDATTLDPSESPTGDTSAPKCSGNGQVAFTAESDVFRVDRGGDEVESHLYTLANEGDCSITVTPDRWAIEGKQDGEWVVVAEGSGDGTVTLEPGESHRWSLSLSTHPTPHTDEKTFVFPDGEFPAGTYSFRVLAEPNQGSGGILGRAQFELRYTSETSTAT